MRCVCCHLYIFFINFSTADDDDVRRLTCPVSAAGSNQRLQQRHTPSKSMGSVAELASTRGDVVDTSSPAKKQHKHKKHKHEDTSVARDADDPVQAIDDVAADNVKRKRLVKEYEPEPSTVGNPAHQAPHTEKASTAVPSSSDVAGPSFDDVPKVKKAKKSAERPPRPQHVPSKPFIAHGSGSKVVFDSDNEEHGAAPSALTASASVPTPRKLISHVAVEHSAKDTTHTAVAPVTPVAKEMALADSRAEPPREKSIPPPAADYSKCSLLQGAPRAGDVIAFKVRSMPRHICRN